MSKYLYTVLLMFSLSFNQAQSSTKYVIKDKSLQIKGNVEYYSITVLCPRDGTMVDLTCQRHYMGEHWGKYDLKNRYGTTIITIDREPFWLQIGDTLDL